MVTLLSLLARLPLPFWHGVGWLVGWLAYGFDQRYAQRLRDNLQQSGLARDSSHYTQLLHSSIGEIGKGAIELLIAWFRPPQLQAKLVKNISGWPILEEAVAKGKGVILMTPHLGGFELAGIPVYQKMSIMTMYRPPRQKWLDKLMQHGRKKVLGESIPADLSGVRKMLKFLKQGGITVILPDQAPQGDGGVWVPFFGKPAYTMTLISKLRKATGAELVWLTGERLPRGRGFHLHFHSFAGQMTGDEAHDALLLSQNIEAQIARLPDQYLWSYNRYKQPAGAPPPAQELSS